jgi:hypothetical protein
LSGIRTFQLSITLGFYRSPDLFAFWVTTDQAIHDRRLPGLGMRVSISNGVDLDIFRIVHINEFLIDVRPIRPGILEIGIELACFISNLKRKLVGAS